MTTIALAGNPNCGKTTLFNALTGARQRVGNWPGVTVERKSGKYRSADGEVAVLDLPGLYALDDPNDAIDERIVREYLADCEADAVVNVVDASSLGRGLYLTLELLQRGHPMLVALNMMDVAERRGLHIDVEALSRRLGCPVVPIVASRGRGLAELKQAAEAVAAKGAGGAGRTKPSDALARFRRIDKLIGECVAQAPAGQRTGADSSGGAFLFPGLRSLLRSAGPAARTGNAAALGQRTPRSATDRIDALVLNRFLAFPIFLGVMYLMFMFSINVGSAFIDFFDLTGSVLFVEGPRRLFMGLGLADWLTVLLADGVGGGVALVATFIPVIGCLFLALSLLEDSGYMARVAFIVDRLMRSLGLPGKSFVPLIVGFGCNVPAVMATRTLENEPDRILTAIMAPYMSCGARLTVYALFAAAFFPHNGQNVVFGLYLIGIALAVLSAFVVKKRLLKAPTSTYVMELPSYHLPTPKGIALQTWQRLKGFVLRAGKAIVAVVVVLNLVSSIGADGSIGNENSEKSILSVVGKAITPAFHPLGIDQDNWPATVGIFTGIFAKEVVVGTLDALYAPAETAANQDLTGVLTQAAASVPRNLSELGSALADPLGLDIGAVEDPQTAAAEQEVALGTIAAMQSLFHGEIGAFSYLLFILLYMPCVATIGVIYKEIGAFWAVFSTGWSVVMAYSAAVVCYQIGTFSAAPLAALGWLVFAVVLAAAAFTALLHWGQRRQASRLIPLLEVR